MIKKNNGGGGGGFSLNHEEISSLQNRRLPYLETAREIRRQHDDEGKKITKELVKEHIREMVSNLVPCFEDEIAEAFKISEKLVYRLYIEVMEEESVKEEEDLKNLSPEQYVEKIRESFLKILNQ